MKVLCFGSCNIDYVYSLDHIVAPGETVAASAVASHPGGKGLNQAVALGRGGAPVYFAGCIGDDGEFLNSYMRTVGVDTSYIKKVEDKTGQAFIQVSKSGENSIVIYHGANYRISREYIDSVLSDFECGDILTLQNEINETEYLIDKAHSIGMKIFLNPSPFDEKIKSVDLNKIHCLIVNSHEAAEYVGGGGYEKFISFIREKYPTLTAVVTLGAGGSVWFDSERKIYKDAYKVKAVDTTGAGDTFTGYFISSVAKGESIEDSLNIASCAAAIAVASEGAASSIPDLSAVKSKLKLLTSDNLKVFNRKFQ